MSAFHWKPSPSTCTVPALVTLLRFLGLEAPAAADCGAEEDGFDDPGTVVGALQLFDLHVYIGKLRILLLQQSILLLDETGQLVDMVGIFGLHAAIHPLHTLAMLTQRARKRRHVAVARVGLAHHRVHAVGDGLFGGQDQGLT
ncbi:hypothetical protein PG984_005339 [Apiospora sp. TS-2023a]